MRQLKILLAEDDDDLRALYGYMLLAAGYKVNAVRNGLEALAQLQVNRPDLIVTDIAMPVLNGLDLIVAVRSSDELADLPAVAITSFGEDICELALTVGATNAIDKTTELERMREVIDAAVSRSSSARLRSNGGSLSELQRISLDCGGPLLTRAVQYRDHMRQVKTEQFCESPQRELGDV
jgi:CheY-like chemotaxis protein